jgi:hypothetical protein
MTDNDYTASPVSVGDFEEGQDTMLWNPQLSRTRWRREILRAALPPRVVLCGLLGAALAADGIVQESGLVAVLMIGLGVLAFSSATLAAVVNAGCFATDHVHEHARRCHLEQCPGEFFYRTKDFTAQGASVQDAVAGILDAVSQLQSSPAQAWLDPSLAREAHLVAWDVLCCVDRTRTARAVADQLRCEPQAGVLAARANDALRVIDQALADVLWHLRGCVTLAQAWTAKLHHAGLEARVQVTLQSLRDGEAERIAAAAEALPQNVFAYVTAARDVTNTGPFPWEQPMPPQPPTRPPAAPGSPGCGERTLSDGGVA